MIEHEIILDFADGEMDEKAKARLIKAVNEGKKFRTTMTYFGDGDYNAFYTPELSMVFNTNTSVSLAKDMGFSMDLSQPSEEDMKEIMKDYEENGFDDGFKVYLEESKNDFLE